MSLSVICGRYIYIPRISQIWIDKILLLQAQCWRAHNYIANIFVENDQIELAWQKVRDDDFSLDSLVEGGVTGIDAKAVMQLLEVNDYYEMVERISERFKDKTAYDDLLAYLHENGIFERDED